MAAVETFGLTEASLRDKEQQDKVIKDFELQRKIRHTVVPTDDSKVRQLLRQLGDPITLFGEREMERRERLKKIIALREGDMDLTIGQLETEEAPRQTELFYTEGPPALRTARYNLAQYSLRRAQERIRQAKSRREDVEQAKAYLRGLDSAAQRARGLTEFCSEVAGARPVSCCQFSAEGDLLATGGWDGSLTVWEPLTCRRLWQAKALDDRCTGLAWSPLYRRPTPEAEEGGDEERNRQASAGPAAFDGGSSLAIATGGSDGVVKLWAGNGSLLRKLEGHTDRLARVSFHPLGRHLASASFDLTWRLWDATTGACLLEQEGHSRPVYTVAFHPDGSLALSAGLDAYARLWDLRSGRAVTLLEGHLHGLLSADFAPDGWRVATAGMDNTCKIWDLRKRKCLYTIPTHTALVSSVRFEPQLGAFLATSSYDGLIKIWSGRDFRLLKTLAGHEGKVMCTDMAPAAAMPAAAAKIDRDSYVFASVSYDRTLKFWAVEEGAPLVSASDEDEDEDEDGSSEGDVAMVGVAEGEGGAAEGGHGGSHGAKRPRGSQEEAMDEA